MSEIPTHEHVFGPWKQFELKNIVVDRDFYWTETTTIWQTHFCIYCNFREDEKVPQKLPDFSEKLI